MSREHVDAMNALLVDNVAVKAECGKLTQPYALAYRLAGGPGGETVHWTMTFNDTVQFSLDEHPSPDVLLVGDWRRMVSASRASREGEQVDPGVHLEDDPGVMAVLAPAFGAAQSIATVPVTFPEL